MTLYNAVMRKPPTTIRLLWCFALGLLTVASYAQQFDWGTSKWMVRTGTQGVPTYDAKNFEMQPDGKVLLKLGDDGTSAGIMPVAAMGYGTYTWIVYGDLHNLAPHSVFAIWFYDDRPARKENFEFDIEIGTWGDENAINDVLLSAAGRQLTAPVPEVRLTRPTRRFNKHRVTLTYLATGVGVRIEGWWRSQNPARWMEYAGFWHPRPTPAGVTPRVALWQYAKALWFPGASRGLTSVLVEPPTFVPAP